MKLRTSFFNGTILKKDLTRFLPLWVIYLILGLLILLGNVDGLYYSIARVASESLNFLSIVMLIYALLAAQLLFGELFQGRLCNAIHAMPVRREGLFFTHFAAGMIMATGPNLVIALVAMLFLEKLWFVSLLWWLALTLQYLVFFSIAVFCMHCAGNRFAAVAMYAMLNFVALVVMWFFEVIYLPMLYGMEMTDGLREIFYLFSPVMKLTNGDDWMIIEHSTLCKFNHYSSYKPAYDCLYIFKGFGKNWIYLAIITVVGLLFAAASLMIYRKRHMESAGDFVSFKPMGTMFTLLASASLGLLLHIIVPTAGMLVGALVGFFICRMLLERTIKVFNKKSWLKLGALCLVVAISLSLTWFDVLGVASRIPKTEEIASVTIADRYLGDWRLEDLQVEETGSGIVTVGVDPSYSYSKDGMLTLTEEKDINAIREIHRLLLEEGDARLQNNRYTETITIHYILKNGTTLTRYYYTNVDSPAMQRLQIYTGMPKFILGYDTPEKMLKYLQTANIYWEEQIVIEDPVWLEKLVNALFADVEQGQMDTKYGYIYEIHLEYRPEPGMRVNQYLPFPDTASYTVSFLKEYAAWLKENDKTAA